MTTEQTVMDADLAAKLLEPFPSEQIGLLPRVTCSACSKSQQKHCGEHQRRWCDDCKSMISERHIHLSYVGHADVTRRLSEVDPWWTWEPFATDSQGAPLTDNDDAGNPVGLWIRLTVGGVARPGYGSCPSSQNDAVKVLIGDALRNAALRFGVAVDLWAKGDRAAPSDENATGPAGKAQRSQPAEPNPRKALENQIIRTGQSCNLRLDDGTLAGKFAELNGGLILTDATDAELRTFLAWLEEDRRRGVREHKGQMAEIHGETQAGTVRKDSPKKPADRFSGRSPDDGEWETKPAEQEAAAT